MNRTNGGKGTPAHRVNSSMDMAVFDTLPPDLRHALNFSALKYGSEQVRNLGADAAYLIAINEEKVRADYRARVGLTRPRRIP